MIFLPQLPLYVIAIICGLLSFVTTRISMPIIIRKLENAEIVGTDLHKSWKPIVAEMGGFGILFGFIVGIFSGICLHDLLTFPLCIVLIKRSNSGPMFFRRPICIKCAGNSVCNTPKAAMMP